MRERSQIVLKCTFCMVPLDGFAQQRTLINMPEVQMVAEGTVTGEGGEGLLRAQVFGVAVWGLVTRCAQCEDPLTCPACTHYTSMKV